MHSYLRYFHRVFKVESDENIIEKKDEPVLSPGSSGVIDDSSETKADHDKDDQSQEASKENVTKEEDELVLSPGSLGVINDNSETKSDQDEDDQDCQVGYRVSK